MVDAPLVLGNRAVQCQRLKVFGVQAPLHIFGPMPTQTAGFQTRIYQTVMHQGRRGDLILLGKNIRVGIGDVRGAGRFRRIDLWTENDQGPRQFRCPTLDSIGGVPHPARKGAPIKTVKALRRVYVMF